MKTAADSPRDPHPPQGAFRPESALARRLPWIAAPYAFALLLLLARQPDVVGLMYDDGIYLSMARSIEQGEGPVDGHTLERARTARFPPLHPLLLAVARPLLGVARDGVEGVSRLVALNAIWLGVALFAFLRWVLRHKRWPPLLALSAAALVFTLPYVIGLAQHLMSECLFLAELGVAILACERARAHGTVGSSALAGAAAGLLPATRAAGAGMVLGLAFHVAMTTRSGRRVGAFVGAALVPWLIAIAWSSSYGAPAIDDSALLRPPYLSQLRQNLGEAPWIAWVNLARCCDLVVDLLATSAPPAAGALSALARAAVVLLLLAAASAGVARTPRERRGPELPAAFGLIALLLPWPYADVRFLVPIAGLLVVALVEATSSLAARDRGRSSRPAPTQPAAVGWSTLLLALAAWNTPFLRRTFAAGSDEVPFFFVQPIPAAPLRETGEWLARNTPEGVPFASTIDAALHLLARRPGVSPWFNDQGHAENYEGRASRWRTLYGGPPDRAALDRMFERADDVLAEYRRLGVRHVVVVRSGSAGLRVYDSLAAHLVRTNPATAAHFRPVFTSSDGSISIAEFDDGAR